MDFTTRTVGCRRMIVASKELENGIEIRELRAEHGFGSVFDDRPDRLRVEGFQREQSTGCKENKTALDPRPIAANVSVPHRREGWT